MDRAEAITRSEPQITLCKDCVWEERCTQSVSHWDEEGDGEIVGAGVLTACSWGQAKDTTEALGVAESATTTDCISRKDAIEVVTRAIRDKFSFADWYEQLLETGLEIENLIKELPPVTPTVSEDCISREYMLKLQRELHGWMPNDKSHELWQKIKDAPSVTPTERTGEWIPCTKGGLPLTELGRREGQKWYGYKCSKCNFIYKGNALTESPFCQNCGAKMKGGPEDE